MKTGIIIQQQQTRQPVSLYIFLFLFSCSFSAFAQSGKTTTLLLDPVDAERDRKVPLKIYFPKTSSPAPVILCSHGLGGSREACTYLGTHWAEQGYVGVFMQHIGSDRSVWEGKRPAEIMKVLKAAAGARELIDRLNDVHFIIDQLEKWNDQSGHQLAGRLDLEHIGMSGHSFGAVTTLGVSGRKFIGSKNWYDPRIDAFLPLSPQGGRNPEQSFGELKVPLLCMTGTKDGSPIDPTMTPESRQDVYKSVPPGDKYQLVLEGAEHSAFGDTRRLRKRNRNPNHHPAIQTISTKFWDAYLRGDTEAKAWLQSKKPRSVLEEKDTWEWK